MQERRGVSKRKFGYSLLVIFIIGVWLKNTYDDKSFIESDIELYQITSLNKDTVIMGLRRSLDSLKRVKQKVDTIFIYPVKKEFKRSIVDTTPTIIDSSRVMEVDSLGPFLLN